MLNTVKCWETTTLVFITKQKRNKLEINDYFALTKKEIVSEISPEKDEFRDTYQIHQLIAKTGRAGKKIRTLKLGIFIHFRGCSGQKKKIDNKEEQMINVLTYLETL